MAENQHGTALLVTKHVFDTEYPADSVEFCPCEQFTDLLLCGTYQLIEPQTTPNPPDDRPKHVLDDSPKPVLDDSPKPVLDDSPKPVLDAPQKRVGRVYIFSVQTDTSSEITCEELNRIETSGVLDIKWSSTFSDDGPIFAVADSDGKVNLYNISGQSVAYDRKVAVLCETSITDEEEKVLVLSLDWSTAVDKSSPSKLICSDSAGRLSLLSCNDGSLTILSQWSAHQFEAWITAFNAWDTNIVFSGGDDCLLKGWDLRTLEKPVFVSKRHEMGVVSIQSNPIKEHLLATGSYDEHLLIWDTRQMKTPLSDTHLGGGLFRVKWHPGHGSSILTASMHNGFHVINADTIPDDGSTLNVIGHYRKGDHGSLAYGADWSRAELSAKSPANSRGIYKNMLATCSFYDHSLHIWNFTF